MGIALDPVKFPTTVLAPIAAMPPTGRPRRFVAVPLAGVPRTGAVMVGEVSVLLVSV